MQKFWILAIAAVMVLFPACDTLNEEVPLISIGGGVFGLKLFLLGIVQHIDYPAFKLATICSAFSSSCLISVCNRVIVPAIWARFSSL